MYNRPKLDIPKTPFEKAADLIGAIVFISWIGYLVYAWGQLPDQVPGHYDGAGQVDRWGTKWELIILPIIAALLIPLMAFLEKHPEWHNYMNLNESNIEFQYKNSRLLLNIMKNEILLFLAYISFNMIRVTLGKAESLGAAFLPVFIGILFGTMIFFVVRSLRKK
ncbi:putative membrane protein [Sporosarcina luteola]|nr:putative membrane protein [Sporosarcina luteola]